MIPLLQENLQKLPNPYSSFNVGLSGHLMTIFESLATFGSGHDLTSDEEQNNFICTLSHKVFSDVITLHLNNSKKNKLFKHVKSERYFIVFRYFCSTLTLAEHLLTKSHQSHMKV